MKSEIQSKETDQRESYKRSVELEVEFVPLIFGPGSEHVLAACVLVPLCSAYVATDECVCEPQE